MSFQQRELVKILLIIAILAGVDFIGRYLIFLFITLFPQYLEYEPAALTALNVIIIAVGGYYIIKLIQHILSYSLYSKLEKGMAGIIKFSLDVVFYTLLVLAILSVLGVNLTGVLVGSAVGGIVIGLAIQNVAQNLLSGLMVTSSKTIKPGDSVSLLSWIWGSPIIGEVTKVSILFTEVKSITGNIYKIPNSAFLGNTVFQKLESESSLVYPLQITVNADVPAEKVLQRANEILKDELKNRKCKVETYLYNKNGGTNVFLAIIHFEKLDELRDLINIINSAFDKAYWSSK